MFSFQIIVLLAQVEMARFIMPFFIYMRYVWTCPQHFSKIRV